MTHEPENLSAIQKEWHGNLKSYVVGFSLSLLLSALSFFLVWAKIFSGKGLFFAITGLAIVQATAQILFFLHVGQESKPRWETLIFLFMVLVVLIIISGSLWIMYDLDHRVM